MIPITLALTAVAAIIWRLHSMYLNRSRHSPRHASKHTQNHATKKRPHRTMVILGSGGHTTEMFRLIRALPVNQYHPRVYVIADTDAMSEAKAREFETKNDAVFGQDYRIVRIPRAREVRQSFLTSIFTTLRATFTALRILKSESPDLIISNGPGTSLPLLILPFLFAFFNLSHPKTVFVESFARVNSLSLTGKLVYPFVDTFVVQWPALKQKYKRAEYIGWLV